MSVGITNELLQKTMGTIIRVRRVQLGLQKQELAQKAGVANSTVGRLEYGNRRVTADVLVSIFDSLDLPFSTAVTMFEEVRASFGDLPLNTITQRQIEMYVVEFLGA